MVAWKYRLLTTWLLWWAAASPAPAVPAGRTLAADAKPSFRVEPLIHRLQVLPGQRRQVVFELTALERDLTLECRPVGLTQRLDGLILPDEGAAAAAGFRLASPERLVIRRGRTGRIEGWWSVPAGAAGSHSVGLLVTDVSPARPPVAADTPAAGGSGARVRFVTRYLLRVDAQVGRAGAPLAAPTIERAALVERNGRAVATALVRALPEEGGAWQATARLLCGGRPVGAEFPLGLPVRANQPLPTRHELVLLPGSRVLAAAATPDPVAPGQYDLEVRLSRAGRTARVAASEVEVREGDFPAQATVLAQVVREVSVSPSVLEFSMGAGGDRLLPLSLVSRSAQGLRIRLVPKDLEGGGTPGWLSVRPPEFTLPPGGRRKVLVAVRGAAGLSTDRYARLRVEVAPTETTAGGATTVPVALLAGPGAPSVGDWGCGPLRYRPASDGQRGEVTALVRNDGPRRLAVRSRLELVDELDRAITSEAGHGAWVLPGEELTLRHPTPALPPGEYCTRQETTVGDDAEPVVRESVLVVRAD